ncbi:TetR family transcriptional regulator [Stackebrandtia albiflava]|uniref:TetR family transcriptional regulator n=1 Tax=Stackebrandtia albiflava TaxID=406432 RepID=A0A562VEA3_9ACTN|nr:TetR family transcriptional regulator [Stackebrandtia albiflava]TWJ16213.1 TetR family transcriptional regulator [Stackebrandtia albiflava]
MANAPKRSGRRPGSPDTREEILAAARDVFAADGFERGSLRRIAAAAGVDPALIHHYFGTKDRLFLAAVEAPFDPADLVPTVFGPGVEGVGERLVRTFIGIWDSPGGNRAAAFLRSAINHRTMSTLVEQFVINHIIKNAVRHLDVPVDHVETRGSMIASQLLGLALTRNLMGFRALRAMDADALAVMYGPTIQRYLTADPAELGLPHDA